MNLRELIKSPGSRLSFTRELSTDRLALPAVLGYNVPPAAEGEIVNNAGALTLRCVIRADLHCQCDRCTREFDMPVNIPLEYGLAAELEDEEDPDYFLLNGDELDIDDLLESGYILNMDMQFLCRDDCKGLCPRCGADLNDGPCGCKAESDPRLAVLEQLLDDIDNE